jgi:hypothetical protein
MAFATSTLHARHSVREWERSGLPAVKLKGLNIRSNSAGVWYVSYRSTGTLLGKAASRDALDALMETPAFLQAYVLAQTGKRKITYPEGTFGALVDWYQTRPEWLKLAPRTQADYQKALYFIEPAYGYAAGEIELADVAELRDQAAAEHHAKFSDTVIAVMSAVFQPLAMRGR